MKNCIVIILIIPLLVFNSNIYAQNAQSYSRSSISTIFLKHSGDNLSLFNYANSIQVAGKFDYNYFGKNTMNVDFQMVSPSRYELYSLNNKRNELSSIKNKTVEIYTQIGEINSQIKETKKKLDIENAQRHAEMLKRISDNKIANKALGSILIDPNLGYMTTDVMAKRGLYNATDAEYLTAMNSERKIDMIKDKGLELLGNTYIIVYDITDYDLIPEPKDNSVGMYSVKGAAYLLKIKVDNLKANGEFDNLIFTEPNPEKLEKFNNYNFPVEELFIVTFSATAPNYEIDFRGQRKLLPDAQVQKSLLASANSNVDEEFLKLYAPFQVQSSIFTSKPISVKIGSKESLKIDDIYKVTENRMSKSGIVTEKRIGWVRANRVVNNKSNATGSSQASTFYKVASKRIDKGMKIKEVAETGIVLGVGYYYGVSNFSKGNVKGFTGIMDGPVIGIDYITHLLPGLRVGIEFGGFQKISTKDVVYQTGGSTGFAFTGSNMVADLLIQKIFQSNRLEFTPYLGGYYSTLTFDKYTDNTNKEFQTKENPVTKGLKNTQYGIAGGVKLGINFGRHLQFNVGYKYWKSLSEETKNENKSDILIGGKKINLQYSNPGAVSVGLRLFGF